MITYNLKKDDSKIFPVSFHTVCDRHPQETVSRENGASVDQILLVVEGAGVLKCQGQTHELRRGSAFYVSKSCPVEYVNTGGLVSAFLTFNGDSLRSVFEYYGAGDFLFYKSVSVGKYVDKISEITELYYNTKLCGLLSAKVYAFIVEFLERRNKKMTSCDEVAAYIRKNFTGKLTLEQLSMVGQCCVSKLCHDFKRQLGYSVVTYINDVRLGYAKELLQNDEAITVKAAAMSCGFEDVSYFCRAYKKKFGKTPTGDR